MELKIGETCGSCIHTNRPKTPREHAAHYEVAKTERWCYKHNCHVTRETTCGKDYQGVNRAAKTAYTRIIGYNERAVEIRKVMELMDNKPVFMQDRIYFIKNNWLYYVYGTEPEKLEENRYNYHHRVQTKHKSVLKDLKEIREKLKA